MKIIAFYDPMNITLVEHNGTCFIVKIHEKPRPAEIYYKGDEEICTKAFILLMAGEIESAK